MALRLHRSFGIGLLGAALALVASGCAEPVEAARPGELELVVDPLASYAMVGRFQVNAIEPWSPSRDIDFDTSISSARLELPAGSFTLALGAGARLVCAGEDDDLSAPSAVPRLVSAPPRVISIAPGQVTKARISFGGTPPRSPEMAQGSASAPAEVFDPCGTSLEIAEVASALR
jgi:hypothetical protein